jgi:2-polyprenyl-6-methoxyphenol hydroxylase-like FAD-dependent oxidoreductase
LIADGKVKVKSDALPVAYSETGLDFADGSKIDADVIVFATGYKSDLRDSAKRIVGEEVAENLEEFWQCDIEGEPRGAWRDTGRE